MLELLNRAAKIADIYKDYHNQNVTVSAETKSVTKLVDLLEQTLLELPEVETKPAKVRPLAFMYDGILTNLAEAEWWLDSREVEEALPFICQAQTIAQAIQKEYF